LGVSSLDWASPGAAGEAFLRISKIVVPAKAGTHIPEAVVLGPQHKRVHARLRRAMRGDDSNYEPLESKKKSRAGMAGARIWQVVGG